LSAGFVLGVAVWQTPAAPAQQPQVTLPRPGATNPQTKGQTTGTSGTSQPATSGSGTSRFTFRTLPSVTGTTTLSPSSVGTFLNQPFTNPFNNPFAQNFNSPFNNPFAQNFSNPFNNPFNNPFAQNFNSPFNNPFNNPFAQNFNNPFNNPFANPFNNPFNNPFANPFNANPFGNPFNTNPFGNPFANPFNYPPGWFPAPGTNPWGVWPVSQFPANPFFAQPGNPFLPLPQNGWFRPWNGPAPVFMMGNNGAFAGFGGLGAGMPVGQPGFGGVGFGQNLFQQ
jgi:hypothetical protein